MFWHEQIDGPVNQFEQMNVGDVAAGLTRGIANIGWKMHHAEVSDPNPQGFRLATWVDHSEDELGYALGLSRTWPLSNSVAGFALNSVFFTVDRQDRKVLGGPTIIDTNTRTNLTEQIDTTILAYSKKEMAYVIAMIQKIEVSAVNEKFGSEIDSKVGYGLTMDYLDTLVVMFPDETVAPKIYNPIEDPDVA